MKDNPVNDYSYKILKWSASQAVCARHLPKMIYYVCKEMRGDGSLRVPEEYRKEVLEKVVRAMLILNGWSYEDPQLAGKVNEVVQKAEL